MADVSKFLDKAFEEKTFADWPARRFWPWPGYRMPTPPR